MALFVTFPIMRKKSKHCWLCINLIPFRFKTRTSKTLSPLCSKSILKIFLWPTGFKRNWGGGYDIFEDDGEIIGQQFATDTGNMDILAISKDRRELLVVELKKGQAADKVVGQILRYMGYAAQELAEEGQTVKGIIITQEDDLRLRRALSVTPNVSFYRYQVSFKLIPS